MHAKIQKAKLILLLNHSNQPSKKQLGKYAPKDSIHSLKKYLTSTSTFLLEDQGKTVASQFKVKQARSKCIRSNQRRAVTRSDSRASKKNTNSVDCLENRYFVTENSGETLKVNSLTKLFRRLRDHRSKLQIQDVSNFCPIGKIYHTLRRNLQGPKITPQNLPLHNSSINLKAPESKNPNSKRRNSIFIKTSQSTLRTSLKQPKNPQKANIELKLQQIFSHREISTKIETPLSPKPW